MGSIAELREEMLVLEKYWERVIELRVRVYWMRKSLESGELHV